jgi:glyoxylase-like metal-dependent hydrolase (beta-lactamase superfamily II)
VRILSLLACSAITFSAYAATKADGAGLQPGVLPGAWRTGGPNCVTVPDWQIHEYNDDFYVIRESGCIHFEKPFLYLIFGKDKALLEDTGAGEVQTGPYVMSLLAKWAKKKNRVPPPLIVIHSHAHNDHIAGDKQFQNLANVQFIAPTPAAVQKAAGIANWPSDLGSIDLGERIVDVIPIPGHNDASIALYDRLTGNLLTGDSLYPGRLGVSLAEVPNFAASARRLAAFVTTHDVAHVLGTHIEQTKTAFLDYPRGTVYQPEEHSLDLTRAHVIELNDAFVRMGDKPATVALPEFTVVVRVPAPAAQPQPSK